MRERDKFKVIGNEISLVCSHGKKREKHNSVISKAKRFNDSIDLGSGNEAYRDRKEKA